MTDHPSKGLAKGFLLGRPRAAKLKTRFGKHSNEQAKDGCRTLVFVKLEKGLQQSQLRSEKGSNKEVCADPLLCEWVLGSEKGLLGAIIKAFQTKVRLPTWISELFKNMEEDFRILKP